MCKPFHFYCRKREREAPLVGGDSLAILIEMIANFFHDLLIIGIVAQVVVVLVALEPGPGSGGVNGGRRFALRPLRILSDLGDQKLLTAKVARGAKKCLKRQPARRSTKAEFLLPNAMQFATACSMAARRPDCGT